MEVVPKWQSSNARNIQWQRPALIQKFINNGIYERRYRGMNIKKNTHI